ncbi:FAD dependent oxidoreductase-domain-containing protein [Chaetomidium leptoderma]|uniref:FAD dependent oxidoreductase-domain-containing protein n=1 Tax=Chaetomidium leptoderma TaxID=669021 RepID=A0AAN6VLA2_9PEZI|nr:FAD dependent oxidoreductase-domain-containing protein [Chaetomidium leptoderma]
MTIRKVTPTEAEADTGTVTLPPAGLPSRNPTESYWLTDPSPALLGHRGTADLPETADVVVVGSGITGAFAARFLLLGEGGGGDGAAAVGGGGGGGGADAQKGGVVMLEAREACSGATGRNGGHCQPLVYGSVPAVAAFELEVFEFMERFVKEEEVDCDWVSLAGVHAFLSKNMFELAAAEAEQLQKSHPELAAQLEVVRPSDTSSLEKKQTLASLRVPSAQGAIIQKKAASLWPYKLVASILERLIADFPAPAFNLQTNTPVTSLSRAETGPGWTLTTPRGKITARQVLLATNGYTSHLLPAFSDLIVPVRGQIGALLVPPNPRTTTTTTTTTTTKLTHSYVFAADPDPASDSPLAPRDDYLVQRPTTTLSSTSGGGEMIYGGGRRFARGLGVGEWRDDELEAEVAGYLRGNLSPPLDLSSSSSSSPPLPVAAADQDQGGVLLEASFEWTGVMGYSRDHHAWVGPVPEELGGGGAEGGLWVCAGYTGHGMPAAALSAREVVRQMMACGGGGGGKAAAMAAVVDEEGKGVRFPGEFVLSEERVARARGLPHLTQGWEATNFASLISGSGGPAGGKGM